MPHFVLMGLHMMKSCPTLMLNKDAFFVLHYFGLNFDKLETCLNEIDMDFPWLINIVVAILFYANMLSKS